MSLNWVNMYSLENRVWINTRDKVVDKLEECSIIITETVPRLIRSQTKDNIQYLENISNNIDWELFYYEFKR